MGGGAIVYPWDFINIHTCIADRRDHSVYYVWSLQNGIASYAYVICHNTPKQKKLEASTVITYSSKYFDSCQE